MHTVFVDKYLISSFMKDLGIGEKEIGLDAHSKLLHR
jgi:hypothetical protein